MRVFALLAMLAMMIFYSSKVLPKSEKPVEKVKRDRPEFMIVHKGIKPQNCNLAYKHKGEVVRPTLMQIHDYLKWNDGSYYFAVSVGIDRFLLKASDISKENCSKEDLALAFKFAKYCKVKDKPARIEVVEKQSSYTAEDLRILQNWDMEARSNKEYVEQLENTMAQQRSQISRYESQIRSLYGNSITYYSERHSRRCTLNHVHTAACNRSSSNSSRGREGAQISRLENMKSKLIRAYKKNQELLRKKQEAYHKAVREHAALKNKPS